MSTLEGYEPDVLAAKAAIYDVLCRYCRGCDRMDLDLMVSCYHPGALDHHPGFDGPIEEFVKWVEAQHNEVDGIHHVIANHLIEVHGHLARAETYVNGWVWKVGGGPETNFVTGSRYVDTFELRDGEWRIAERWCVRSFIVEGLPIQSVNDPSSGPPALRNRDDVAFLTPGNRPVWESA